MRMFFLPYAYHVVAFCLFLVFLLFYLCIFVSCLFIFNLCLFVSLPGDDVLCWLFSCSFFSVCFPFFFSGYVPGLVWFGSAYLVTMAGFAGDQSM